LQAGHLLLIVLKGCRTKTDDPLRLRLLGEFSLQCDFLGLHLLELRARDVYRDARFRAGVRSGRRRASC
jgi:hypothetical protein